MQCLGGGSVAIGSRDFRVRHKSTDQCLEMEVLERTDKIRQVLPEFVDISGSFRKIVGEFNFGIAQLTQLMDGELKAVLILVDQDFNLQEIVLLYTREHFFHVVPHLVFQLSAAVAER